MTLETYAEYDAVALADLVARRAVSASDLLETAIAEIERLDPSLNAVAHRHYDEARAAVAASLPAGRFRGVPFLLKDLDLALAGTVLSEGSRLMAGYVPDFDSTLVARYKAAGLVILGKTNSAELGLSFTTEPLAHGPTRNPRDPLLSAGGSSGGAAAAVASGMVPMAHATDGGGSIRQPAALNGLFGLKPSRGRTPPGPNRSEIFFGISVSHALTRSVRDSAALLDATLGTEPGAIFTPPDPGLRYEDCAKRDPAPLRIALQRRPFNGAPVERSCGDALDEAARLCEAMGHIVEEAAPAVPFEELARALGLLSGAFTADRIDAYAAAAGIADPLSLIEPGHAAFLRATRNRPAREVVAALETVRGVGRVYARFFETWDVILSPVTATATLPLGWLASDAGDFEEIGRRAAAHAPFTAPCNAAGIPAMSVPFAQNGVPVGAQFAAAFGREDLLFSLAGAIERARPGWRA
jgi:Asp-tRNA(Asn)/Glu-tRNA(Gln) amidotransferase A subunit family amidase